MIGPSIFVLQVTLIAKTSRENLLPISVGFLLKFCMEWEISPRKDQEFLLGEIEVFS